MLHCNSRHLVDGPREPVGSLEWLNLQNSLDFDDLIRVRGLDTLPKKDPHQMICLPARPEFALGVLEKNEFLDAADLRNTSEDVAAQLDKLSI